MRYDQFVDFILSSTVFPNTFVLAIASTVCIYRVMKLRDQRVLLGARWLNLIDFTIVVFALFLQSCAASWSRLGKPLGWYEMNDADELLLIVRLMIFFAGIRLIYRITHRQWRAHVVKLAIFGAVILAVLSGFFAYDHKLYCQKC